jgi:hypothetical protein
MRAALIALFLIAANTAAWADGEAVRVSETPTGKVTDQNGMVVEYCYATKTRVGKHIFYNPMDCKTPNIRNYANMSWTIDEPPINMKGIREAHHAKILPNGRIQLY